MHNTVLENEERWNGMHHRVSSEAGISRTISTEHSTQHLPETSDGDITIHVVPQIRIGALGCTYHPDGKILR